MKNSIVMQYDIRKRCCKLLCHTAFLESAFHGHVYAFKIFQKSFKAKKFSLSLLTTMFLPMWQNCKWAWPCMQKRAGPKNLIFVISDQGAIHPYGPYPGRRTFVQMQSFAQVLKRIITYTVELSEFINSSSTISK